jgi:hypothetical protein
MSVVFSLCLGLSFIVGAGLLVFALGRLGMALWGADLGDRGCLPRPAYPRARPRP